MAIRAIVFDFGNVVGFFDHRLTSKRLAQHSSLPVDAIHSLLFGGALEQDYDAGLITTEEFLRRVRETCKITCPKEEVRKAWADIFWPNQEVCALLPELSRNYRLLLASNTNELHATQFQSQFQQELQPFHERVLSYQIKLRKPESGFFEVCRRHAGRSPEECLFIDDLPANVAGAQACGWHGVVYTGFSDFLSRLSAFGIEGFAGVRPAPRPIGENRSAR